jgi:uncharacterized delta-60 repeat protein
VKTIREIFANLLPACRARATRWLKPVLPVALALAAGAAGAQPANDNFTNAAVLGSNYGTTNGDNTLATLEPCEATTVNTPIDVNDAQTNSVWFQWTAPANGTVEMDTAGSAIEVVLSVWTTAGGLCDPSLSNIAADDDGQGTYSEVNFSVTAGTTYYISVASWFDGTPGDNVGAYVLNWTSDFPTLPAGGFSFTASTYTVSDSDSDGLDSADNNTLIPTLMGARITVTRPAPAYGAVLVDYTVAGSTYTNLTVTNYYGTNVITLTMSTSTPPVITFSNVYNNYILVTNSYQIFDSYYQTVTKTFALTNTVNVTFNVGLISNSSTAGTFSVPTNFPFLSNFQLSSSVGSETFTTNVFGYLQRGFPARGTNFLDQLTYTNSSSIVYTNFEVFFTNTFITNFFGTNISLVYQSPGALFTTNYYFTNEVMGMIYSSNSIYTNGSLSLSVPSRGTNWFTNNGTDTVTETILNESNIVDNVGPQGYLVPTPTNVVPFANYSTTPVISTDPSGNAVATFTEVYGYAVSATNVVPTGAGIQAGSNTLFFANLQMSADILVPLQIVPMGPDYPDVPDAPDLSIITLSNPRLAAGEDAGQIIPPTITTPTAQINALGFDFIDVPNLADVPDPTVPPPGVFNFERSTFRTFRNQGVATISVDRIAGNPSDSVSVDYIIDPDYPNYAAITPRNVDDGDILHIYHTANTFPLQADSDYATPNSDYTPVSGTLTWVAYDYGSKQITISITNNGLVEFNSDMLIQLHNALPLPATGESGMLLGEINQATLTILFDDTYQLGGVFPGQQPAGAVDRTWNKDNADDSDPPYLVAPGTTPGLDGTVYAVAEQPDGSAIIAGSFISYDSNPYNRIVRVLPNGYQDPTFQGNSSILGNNSGANDEIEAVALQPDGRIIIGGNFTSFNGSGRHYLARLNPNGSLDTTFGTNGAANGRILSIALESSGQIIIGGEFTSYGGTNVNKVARLNPNGLLDLTFNPGAGPDGIVNAVAVDASQRVLIGGNFAHVAGVNSGGVGRLNVDGSLDTTFTPGIGTFNPESFSTDPVKAIAVDANGKILIGGAFSYYNLTSYNGLARLNPDGTLDLTLQSGTGTLNPVTGVADTVNTIVLDPAGNILIGGDFTTYNQTRRYGLARIFADGSLDTSIMDTTYNQYAGIPNQYFNANYVSPTYPFYNTRNEVFAIALETNTLTTSSNIIIGGTFEMVGGGETRDATHPRSNVARVIGGSTPGPGNIELQYPSYSVNNSDGTLYVSLVRTNGFLGTATAAFNVTTAAPGPGIAVAGTDFTPSSANPLWVTTWSQESYAIWLQQLGEYGPNYNEVPTLVPRNGQADVIINVFNSGNISGNLSANFGLSAPGSTFTLGGEYLAVGTALGAQMAAPLTIIDSNVKSGVVGFSSPVYSVIENGSTATINITRTNGSTGSITVYYATTDGTATNGIDYVGITNSVTLTGGSTNVPIFVVTKGHYTSIQPDKTVNLRLFTPSAGSLGLSNAVLTLINPNYQPGHISFSATNYPVNENAGDAVITVSRLGGSATTLGVTLITLDGTAFNGTNYIGSTNVLLWNSGDTTSRTISIPVIDDGIATPNLVAYLQLTNSQVNGTNNSEPLAFGGTNALLTINNVDSAGSFQFSAAAYSVKKYAGYALVSVTRTGGSVGTATVNFTTLNDTAMAGTDYTGITNTLTFTNGQLSELINVPILPTTNGLVDLFLQLSTNGLVTTAALGNPTNATLYIIDSGTVNEPPGSGDPTYSPFAGFNGDVYALALQPNNQLLVGGDFTMADGVTRNCIARLNSDGSLDADFSLPTDNYGANATVSSVAVQADGRILLGGLFTNVNAVARGRIARLNADGTLDSLFNPGSGADNPVYAVAQTFVSGNPMVLIGGAFATVNGTTFNGIGRLNSDGTPDTTFNVGGLGANATVYALAVQNDGKVLIGGDFTTYNGATNFNHLARLNTDGSVDTNFNVSASGASGSVRAITLQLDGKILLGGLFTNVNGVALNHIARLNADGTVDATFNPGLGANDVVSAIALQSDTRIVLGGQFTTCSGVTRNRITRLNPDGTVDPTINFGTGANNFVAAIAIQEDTIEGYPTNVPDEKIIIGGGFTEYNSQTNEHIARIFGGSIGGSGAFQFSSANYQVDEEGTNVLITVLRTGGTSNAPTGDIFVTAYTSGGTAVAGTNYIAISTNLDFPLGESVESFVVPVMDDGVVTPNLTVNLAITNPTAPAEIGNQPTAVLTIINDDSEVYFANATPSVPKDGGPADISIIRYGGTNGTSTVNFSTISGGTATPGTDYTPVNETVTFNPGDTNVVVLVPINNNGIPEGNQTVALQLTGANGTILVAPTNAVLTIIDTVTAPGELSFASPSYSVTEGGGTGFTIVYFTVQRTFGSYGSVSVGYTTQDGTAVAGVKYAATNGIINFTDNETSKTFPVAVYNTATAEGPESFSIHLFTNALTGSTALVSPTNTVVTIFNTNTGVAFASAANVYTEPSGPVTGTLLLNVVRFNNTNGTTTVNFTTTNGTAVSGTDFIGVTNGTVTFNPGDSVKSIALTTMHNPLVTGDLFFTVGLANPSGSAQLTSPSFTVVTDHDADAGISFYTNATSVFRNAGVVPIVVICSNTNAEPVSVHYSTGGGTAVAGKDYTATSGTLTFTNGAPFSYFLVPILLNNSVQSNLTFNVSLSAPTPPGVLVPPSVETVTIVGTNTPAGLSFSTPIVINGVWGVTNANNAFGAPEANDPLIAGFPAQAPVWFEWTAPPGGNGEVTLDTIGSLSTNGIKLDTVLAVFTGASLGNLSQVAANDDLYPNFPYVQENESVQNIFNTNVIVYSNSYTIGSSTYTFFYTNTAGEFYGFDTSIEQPFNGPSGLRFNAKAGTTYYIAADTKASAYSYTISNGFYVPLLSGRGQIQLNWAYHPAGVFRFATENVDETGILGTNGNPMLLYQCAETEGEGFGEFSGTDEMHRQRGPYGNNFEPETTLHAYYHYDVQGLLVTVTRVAGASGRVSVDYNTVDGNTNIINNGDIPAIGDTDYLPVSGTLIFDDFEMSKTFVVPIIDDEGVSQPNRDFMVVLSNPQRDPAETANVSAPRVDSIFGQVLCRILDCDIDPKGPSSLQMTFTNITLNATNIFTNTVVSLVPTNAVFNFAKANYRIPRDVQDFWPGTPVTVYVNRMGTNLSSVTLHYRFDSDFLDQNGPDDENIEFPLQPGSDYATPTPPNTAGIFGTNSDFAGVGGDSGTLTFPGGANNPNAFQSLPIHFNVQNNHLTEFNKDIHITLYQDDPNNNTEQDGMVAETTVTILFDDTAPPAGSVDELYNPDFATDLALLTNRYDQFSSVLNPGTDPEGVVYAVVLTTNNQTIIGGAFSTYNDSANTYTVNGIARLNSDGSLDPTFNQGGSGVNVVGAGEFIRSVALTPDNKVVIGGDFTSYNNTQRNGVARLNSDGTLDTSFSTGGGANGEVWSVLVQPDGKVVIGGEFTKYNGYTANHVARLNTDGSLDHTFNSSNLVTGPVYTMALSAETPLNFARASNGSTNEDDQIINLGMQTAGTLFVTYNMAVNTNLMQIYYGDTNVAAGTGWLLFEATNTGFAVVPFGPNNGPTNGLTTNIITVVVNQGGSTVPPPLVWSYDISMAGNTNLMIGGQFNITGQFFANIARLNTDGSLDASFNPGTGPDGPVLSLGWQQNNQIVIGGSFQHVSGSPFNNLARLNYNGSIDTGFFNSMGPDNSVNSITLQPISGLIYIGGPFSEVNGTHRLGFARLNTDGTVDTSFLDMAYNQFAGLPRILFSDAPAVNASAIQSDGNVIIGGSFQEVGGGQADYYVRDVVEAERGLQPSMDDTNLLVSEDGTVLEPKTRDGVRNHSNVARLIGGATTGPGNIGMVSSSYAVNKTQLAEPVNLVRANGSLGYASANFSVLPGLAQSGTDYSYSRVPPLYPINWEYSGPSRMHSDGEFGSDGLMQDIYGHLYKFGVNGPASILVNIINNTSVSGNLSADFQMANPSQIDQFYLGGQDIPLGVALGISQAPFTLVDNAREDGVFGFASPNYVATNSPLSVAVVRTNGISGTVQISYQTTTNGSTAVVNVDYVPVNGVGSSGLTFNPGVVAQSFPVTILNNGYVSSQEKVVNVQLYNIQDQSGGNAQLGVTNAVVRIINPNFAGYLNFSTNAYYGNLSAGVINFTVTRTVGSKGTLTLQYRTIDGTARNGVNYVGSTNTLTWNNGDVSPRTVPIPLINSSTVGPNKLFAANLLNATLNGANTPSLLGSITNAIFAIINDNSYGTFQFSSPNYQFNEDGGYASITVTRSGSALGSASVSYATADGTAFAGTNYVGTNGVLAFLPGQVARSFNVKLLDDGKTNPAPASFYFGVALTSLSPGSAFGEPTNSLVHIVDAETYNQPPGSLDPSFDPTAGMNASVQALALQSDGQIVAGGSFTVANGVSMNRIARLNTNGTLDGEFLNGLAGADGPVNALISQTDDRIVIGGSFANVDGTTRQAIARLMTDGSLDSSFNSGAGADNPVYALAETFINGARGIYVGGAFSTFNTVSSPGIVRLNNNGLMDTSFAVGSGANGTVYAVAVYPTNSVYNAGQVLVGGLFTNFNGAVVGNLVRLNQDGSLDTNFSQNVSINDAVRAIAIQLDGNILIGGDFTNVNTVAASHLARLNTDGTLDTAFNTAATSGVNGTVSAIALQADNRIMVGGQFSSANGVIRGNITRLLPSGAVDSSINFGSGANGAVNAVVIQPADGNIVIGGDFTEYDGQNRDYIARIFGGSITGSGAFQFTSASYQVDEDGSFASITIERAGGTSGTNADGSGDVFVAFTTTTNGTGVAGVNYVPTTNYVDFPVGEVLQTVLVPVIDDKVITPNLTVTLVLTNPTPGTMLGDQANAVLTIINDDSDVVFDNAAPTVSKGTATGFADIIIDRIGSTSGACTVNFATTTNGTAVIGTDYIPTNTLVTFNPGDTNETVQIAITNNLLPEGNRTVAMVLTNGVNTLLGSPSNAVLTISDNTTNPGVFFFAQTNFAANSSDGTAYLTVLRTNGQFGSVTIQYNILGGTAVTNVDYQNNASTVTFANGDPSEVIKIALLDNPVAHSAVTLIVGLSINAIQPAGAALVAPTNAVLTIYNTNAVFAFTLATNTAAENFSPANIVVERFNNTNIVSTVNYATTNGSAAAGVNYAKTVGTLTFGVGQMFGSIAVPLINQSNVTDLAFGMTLSSPTNAQLIAPSNTVVILQGSAAGVSFTTNAASVFKNAGSLPVTVVCSNPRVEPVPGVHQLPLQVNYTTVDGTAKAGINYNPVSGTLVFTNGVGTNTFNVPIFNQPPFGNQTFSVILTNVTTPGYITPYGTQAVTIVESGATLSFSQAQYSVFKNAGMATINVYRAGSTNGVVSVNYLATNGSAIGGQNFFPTNGTLVFTNGVTSQSFNVAVINNTLVQPNLFALLELSDPTNAQLSKPATATLNILETGGSYVVPAGAMLVTNSSLVDYNIGVIGSNDTVQVLFAFRDSAGQNVTNLVAYLQATNGVAAPSPASETYGSLAVYGHSLSEPFSFTAHGTNGLTISPTFMLYDNGAFIGPATFVFTLGTWTTTFANTNPIIINDGAAASPYPSIIDVRGLGTTLVKATVTVTNLSDQSLGDVSALVVSPTTNTLIMGHVGGSGTIVKHITLTFDDAATNSLPQNGVPVTGTNKPTQFYPIQNFP